MGVELEKERQSIGPFHKEEPVTDEAPRSSVDNDAAYFDKLEASASTSNTDENLPGIKPPTFLVRFPIMTSKGRE